jgi:hypothetical protein
MKKGQAAMEFLMTYGWAILVVIAAIAALAYFGVLDPARLLPERCQSSAGMDCVDKASITATQVTIALRNNIGFDANVTDVAVTGATCSGADEAAAGASGSFVDLSTAEVTVDNNDVFKIRLNTCGLTVGDKFDGTVTVSYENTETGLTHDVPVEIRGKVA